MSQLVFKKTYETVTLVNTACDCLQEFDVFGIISTQVKIMNTCYEMLMQNALRSGNVVYYGHKIAMSKFLEDVDRFATGLSQLNLQKGDVVTVYLPSCPQGLVAFYACSKLGLVANIVHPLIPLKLLKENLVKVNSKVLLFYDALVRNENELVKLGQTLIRCSIADYVTVRKPVFALYAKAIGKRLRHVLTYKAMCKNLRQTPVSGEEQDVVCYMHSGGTSGNPKIVKLTNRSFNQTALGMKLMYHPTVESTFYNLATLPIFHAYGLCAGVHAPLVLGFNLILVPKFDVKCVVGYLNRYRVTCWSVVPAMLKKMLKARKFDGKGLKNLDVIWCGGDVVDESLVEEVDAILSKRCKRARLMRGYGLTEVCGVCVVNNYDYYQKGSCGKAMPTCKAEIWDDDGNVLPPEKTGEIAICSQGNMQGYLEGDSCLVERNGEQWVLTGDVGYLDEEGFLFIVDRKKRTLKIAAVNVFPAQIENCVKTLDFVDEACAVGYVQNDKQFVKVFVTLKVPLSQEEASNAVKAVCASNLIKYSVPSVVEVLPSLPRTPLGKVDYKSLENKTN